MRTFFLQLCTIFLSSAALVACGGGEEGPTHAQFFEQGLKANVNESFDFSLPNETSIKITAHGPGYRADDYAEIEEFDLDETSGKWQIWLAHSVWSNNGQIHFTERNKSVSSLLRAIERIRDRNKLDFEINFLQIDPISSALGIKQARSSNNLSLSPVGDWSCNAFWADCIDRYVVSPFSRHPEPNTVSQRDWLEPILSPVIELLKTEDRDMTKDPVPYPELVFDPNSVFWDRIELMAFIVNPDGQVVDAVVPQLHAEGVSAGSVVTRYIMAAGINTEGLSDPIPDGRNSFDLNDMHGAVPDVNFGGDYVETAMDNLSEMLEE